MTGPRRWLGYLALVIVFAAVCGLLSWWQFSRNAEANERIRQVVDNWDREPAALDTVLSSPNEVFDAADTWTPVRVTGEYDTANQLLVRGRPGDAGPGFEVLVPLVLDGGDGVLIVDRGWVPVGQTQAEVPDSVPAAPEGPVTVVARLKVGEPSVPGRSAPDGQVATIELVQVAADIGLPNVYTGAYGLLATESPAVPTATLLERPTPDPGPYLSYAVQWIMFAIFAASALIWAVFNERRARRENEEAERTGVPAPVRKRRRVGDADSEEEDALLDASRVE